MSSGLPLIIYIHGFNSSPTSEKAQTFSDFCRKTGGFEIAVPALSHDPEAAITQLETLVQENGASPYLLVGSSLGGYYATWLAEQHRCRAVLVNPAVSPVKTLGEEFLGPQKNYYTGEEYDFTRDHALFLDTLDIEPLRYPENYLLLAQSGDEVLDHQLAMDRYALSAQVIQEGGSHRFEHFETMFGPMMEFAEHGTLSQATRDTIPAAI